MDGVSEDRIILRYNTNNPIDLERLTESFSGLASQYRRALEQRNIESDETGVRLFITRIQSGSIEAEIGVAATAFLNVFQFMDYSMIFADFTLRIKSCLDYFAKGGQRPERLDKQDCRDIKAFIGAIKSCKGASLGYTHAKFHQKTDSKETLMEFRFDSTDLNKADRNIDREIIYLENQEAPSFRTFHKVLLRWHQTNKEEAKTAGPRSSDKAIVDQVSDKPLSVFFPPGAEILKRKMTDIEQNPFKKGFEVDVQVQYVGGQAKRYTVLEFHEAIDIDDNYNVERLI